MQTCHRGHALFMLITMGFGKWWQGLSGMFRQRARAGGPTLDPGLARLLWPGMLEESAMPLVWDTPSARKIPGVSRCVAVYSSLVKQMDLQDMRGNIELPPSLFLEQPDKLSTLPRFLQVSVEDYLQDGNTISVIVQRDAENLPAACVWIPITWCEIERTQLQYPNDIKYFVMGHEVDRGNVVHVRRGADRTFPWRGVGVVEEHLSSLDRIAREEAYESKSLKDGGVPSIAVISPNPNTSQPQLEKAKTSWMQKFAGKREPVMLPGGTQVVPLSWSPADAELQAARQLSLLDLANMFNLDGYWVGSPTASMTYQSPTPMFTQMRIVSLENVLKDFEAEWSQAWLPRGRKVRFDRLALTRDDLQTTMDMLITATGGERILTQDEARAYIGRAPMPAAEAAPAETEA